MLPSCRLPLTVATVRDLNRRPARDAALTPLPTISKNSLSGDIRPLMVNATLVNNFFEGVTLKSFYRYYGLSNHSSQVDLPQGYIVLDTGARTGAALENPSFIRMRRIASASRGATISSVGCRPSSAMATTECTGMIAKNFNADE